jgi:hypothetical protein
MQGIEKGRRIYDQNGGAVKTDRDRQGGSLLPRCNSASLQLCASPTPLAMLTRPAGEPASFKRVGRPSEARLLEGVKAESDDSKRKPCFPRAIIIPSKAPMPTLLKKRQNSRRRDHSAVRRPPHQIPHGCAHRAVAAARGLSIRGTDLSIRGTGLSIRGTGLAI